MREGVTEERKRGDCDRRRRCCRRAAARRDMARSRARRLSGGVQSVDRSHGPQPPRARVDSGRDDCTLPEPRKVRVGRRRRRQPGGDAHGGAAAPIEGVNQQPWVVRRHMELIAQTILHDEEETTLPNAEAAAARRFLPLLRIEGSELHGARALQLRRHRRVPDEVGVLVRRR